MRRNFGGDPCCVPNCYRRAKKEVPFCERCWSCLTDEERAGVQIATHAPFYRGVIYLDASDIETLLPYTGGRPAVVPTGLWSFGDEGRDRAAARYGEAWLGDVLSEFEARTTREAVAQAVAQRRRAGNEIITDGEAA
jgi:hypothetical protein